MRDRRIFFEIACYVPQQFTIILYGFGMILHGTNLDSHCFQQKYRGVVFCVEIKVLQMQRNFLTIFFGANEALEALWEGQKSHEGPTRHQGAPGGAGSP